MKIQYLNKIEVGESSTWYDINLSPIRTYYFRNNETSKLYNLYLNLEAFDHIQLKFIYNLINSKNEENFLIAKAITDNERNNSRN